MITFIDGPAALRGLELGRAPMLLRVVVDPQGKWDALDQLGDTPAEGERVYAYERVEGVSHVRAQIDTGRGRRCRCMLMARYQYVTEQPEQAVLRDTEAWQRWALEQAQLRGYGI